jgi:hypothetical protein
LTHYYGALIVGAFLIAEVARTIERKRIDWPLVIGTLLTPSAAMFLIRDLIRAQKSVMAHYHATGSLLSFTFGYDLFIMPAWTVCIGITVLTFGNWLATVARDKRDRVVGIGFSGPEWALAAALLSLPFLGSLASTVTHAYMNRYFAAACAGYAILVCYLAASLHRRCAGVPLLLSIAVMASILHDSISAVRHRHDPIPLASLLPAVGKMDLPVVFQDAKDYIQARELIPEMSSRFYYAAEPELALKMTGTNSDDKIMRALASIQTLHVSRLDDMARQSEKWIVVPASFGWLAPCLTKMQVEMQLVSFPNSAFSGYKVRFPSTGAKTSVMV